MRTIIFDKTGTLTLENPVLLNPDALQSLDPSGRRALSALVHGSLHPIGRCLHENLLAGGRGRSPEGPIEEEVGFGVRMGPWSLGRAGWRDAGPPGPESVFAHAGTAIVRFRFADAARPRVAAELAELAGRGYRIFVLSGDRREKVEALAAELGLPASHALGELTAERKAVMDREHAPDDALMLGDGANDSLAFDRALCRGTPVIHRGILEAKADFYYLQGGIGGIRELFDRGRQAPARPACDHRVLGRVQRRRGRIRDRGPGQPAGGGGAHAGEFASLACDRDFRNASGGKAARPRLRACNGRS